MIRIKTDSRGAFRYMRGVMELPRDIQNTLIEEEPRFIVQELVKLTPPRKKAAGVQSVAESVLNVFWAPDPSKFRSSRLASRLAQIQNNTSLTAQVLTRAFSRRRRGPDFEVKEAVAAENERWRRGKMHTPYKKGRRYISTKKSIGAAQRTLKREVGGAKKGWLIPGTKAPAWVRAANGPEARHTISGPPRKRVVTVENPERAAAAIERRMGLLKFVLNLREKKVASKIKQLIRAKERGKL